jgi:hypothetical protein
VPVGVATVWVQYGANGSGPLMLPCRQPSTPACSPSCCWHRSARFPCAAPLPRAPRRAAPAAPKPPTAHPRCGIVCARGRRSAAPGSRRPSQAGSASTSIASCALIVCLVVIMSRSLCLQEDFGTRNCRRKCCAKFVDEKKNKPKSHWHTCT